MNTLFIYFPP